MNVNIVKLKTNKIIKLIHSERIFASYFQGMSGMSALFSKPILIYFFTRRSKKKFKRHIKPIAENTKIVLELLKWMDICFC